MNSPDLLNTVQAASSLNGVQFLRKGHPTHGGAAGVRGVADTSV